MKIIIIGADENFSNDAKEIYFISLINSMNDAKAYHLLNDKKKKKKKNGLT